MPESAPVSQSAPTPQVSATSPQVAPPAAEPPAQTQAQDAVKTEERRAAALARAKRESSAARAEQEKAQQWRLQNQETIKIAEDYRRLQKLRDENPVAFAKEAGIDFAKLSRAMMEDATGTGKTPAQLVKEEVDRRMAEEAKARAEAEAKSAAEREAQFERQTYEGARRQIAQLLQTNAGTYELAALNPEDSVSKAWSLIEKFYLAHKQVLAYDKALAGVEEALGQIQEKALATKRVREMAEKLRLSEQSANTKTKPVVGSGVVTRQSVETTQQQSPAVQPTRRPRPLDYRKMAEELVTARKASSDS